MYQAQTVWHQTQKPVLPQSFGDFFHDLNCPGQAYARAAVFGRHSQAEGADSPKPAHKRRGIPAFGINRGDMGPQIFGNGGPNL